MKFRFVTLLISLIVCWCFSMYASFTGYESAAVGIFVYELLIFLEGLGKRLVILEIISLFAAFSCLLMPLCSYHYFNSENYLALMWVRYMPVPSDQYYGFMVPATITLSLGLHLPLFFRKSVYKNHSSYMINARHYVRRMKWEGLVLIVIGIVAGLLQPMVPSSLGHVFFLMSYLLFIGVFYCIYSNFPFKRVVVIGAFSILIVRSLLQGMFGEMIYMAMMAIILLLLGRKISLLYKLIALTTALVIVILIQVVKPDYRAKIWRDEEAKGQEFGIFMDLIGEKVASPETIFSNELAWFNMYSRFNEGLFIAAVQNTVPRRLPYADGETITDALLGSIVPRLLWPDKQESGGQFNFKRFLGIDLRGYSVGISPFGEAWGNYGKNGGIVFMFFFGLLFNLIFAGILKIAVKTPSLILWLPLIFFYAVKIESDVFSMVNSLIKASLFTYIMYKLYPVFFRERL